MRPIELYIYTWMADYQSKSEAKNGGHGGLFGRQFRASIHGYFGCQSLAPFTLAKNWHGTGKN